MSIKPIRIVTGKQCWDTKIYEGNEDITEKIGGIFGVDIVLRVDELPKITIHRYSSTMEYISETPNELTIINYKPKETNNKDILENTSYDNAKDGSRKYIKKRKEA